MWTIGNNWCRSAGQEAVRGAKWVGSNPQSLLQPKINRIDIAHQF